MNQIQNLPLLENDAVSQLSLSAENFLHRLLNAVDRYGCFDARPAMLRARLYPLKLNAVTEADMSAWLDECVQAGLISLYQVSGISYLCVSGFKRRTGAHKSPYPAPSVPKAVAEAAQFEPHAGHTVFLHDLYKRENERHLAGVCVRIRYPEVKPAWVQCFNEHLRTEHKNYKEGYEWLEHLKRWLQQNIERLRTEDEQVVSERPAFEAAA